MQCEVAPQSVLTFSKGGLTQHVSWFNVQHAEYAGKSSASGRVAGSAPFSLRRIHCQTPWMILHALNKACCNLAMLPHAAIKTYPGVLRSPCGLAYHPISHPAPCRQSWWRQAS